MGVRRGVPGWTTYPTGVNPRTQVEGVTVGSDSNYSSILDRPGLGTKVAVKEEIRTVRLSIDEKNKTWKVYSSDSDSLQFTRRVPVGCSFPVSVQTSGPGPLRFRGVTVSVGRHNKHSCERTTPVSFW